MVDVRAYARELAAVDPRDATAIRALRQRFVYPSPEPLEFGKRPSKRIDFGKLPRRRRRRRRDR